jgi:hypothetical protein
MIDYSILLQGRIESKSMDFWVNNYKDKKIYVSIWEDDIDYNFPKNWQIIKNKKPNPRLTNYNLDLQVLSTLYGLEKINTKYVIKLRCDEYWSNLDLILSMVSNEPHKIICGSLFFKEIGMHPFSISDHIIAGTLNNVKLMFQSTLNNLKNNFWNMRVPESQLGLAYLWNVEPSLKEKIKDINIYDSYHPDPKPFNSNDTVKLIKDNLASIELFSNRIKNELLFDSINWANVKKWRNIMEYSVNDIKRFLEKSEYPDINEKELIKKHFNIIDVNLLKPFSATFIDNNGERNWIDSNFDEYLCINNLNNI